MSDLVWFDESEYDPATGSGAIGVEFAVTAVSSRGFGRSIPGGNNQSRLLVRDNSELQWSEGYYRGYTELQISHDSISASYFGELPQCTLVAATAVIRHLTVRPHYVARRYGWNRGERG